MTPASSCAMLGGLDYAPNLEYLAAVSRGEIIVGVRVSDKSSGAVFWATGGLYKLRTHEDAGYLDPFLTAVWAGYSESLDVGRPAKLSQKGIEYLRRNGIACAVDESTVCECGVFILDRYLDPSAIREWQEKMAKLLTEYD